MNVVPAQAAGVRSLAVASPPQRDNPASFAGYPHPTILAACALLGVDEVYAVGGAQAIAMFAYGARETGADGRRRRRVVCEPVDLVTGPGNIYVVAAKRLLKGLIGIDAEAGPTEIAILADDTRRPRRTWPPTSSARPSTTRSRPRSWSPTARRWPTRSQAELERQVAATKHARARPHRPDGAAVRHRAGRRRRRRASRSSTPTPPSTWRSRRATRPRSRRGCATRAPSSSGRSPRSASATTAPAPTTCCRPVAAPCHSSGLSVQSFLRGIHVVDVRRGRAARRRRATSSRWPRPRTCPPTAQAVTARFDGDAS